MKQEPSGVLRGELPWPTGQLPGPDVYDPHVDFATGRWTLTGVSREYTLFSSVTLNYIGLSFDPVALFWEESALPMREAPIELDVGRTVLEGLPPPYDRYVYACPNGYAPDLLKFLDRLAATDNTAVYESVRQLVPVVDWPLLAKTSVAPPKPPTVRVHLYGVIGGGYTVVWRPPNDPWTESVRLMRRTNPPKKETQWPPKPPKGTRR